MTTIEDRTEIIGNGVRILEHLTLHDNKIILDSRGKKAKIVNYTSPVVVVDEKYTERAPHWANAILIGSPHYLPLTEGEDKRVKAVAYYLIKK